MIAPVSRPQFYEGEISSATSKSGGWRDWAVLDAYRDCSLELVARRGDEQA
jgi:hypothetical protein